MDASAKADASPGDDEAAPRRDGKLELRVWLRLLASTALIEREVRSRLRRDFDVTLPRFDVLAQLDRAPGGLSMGELSSRLMVSAGNVTGLIERLVQEGLVSRANGDDRRSFRVRLTPRGKVLFDRMAPEHERWIDELMAGLGRDELAALHALLGRLKQSATDHRR